METLYPIFYGTRLVTFDVMVDTFDYHIHPEYARRLWNFLHHQGGKFGIGGGRRTVQPDRDGFAPDGMTFHQDQHFRSGLVVYSAVDLVVVNPGYVHRSPRWEEVPPQGTELARQYGVHCNVGYPGAKGSEAWHMQATEIDGYVRWTNEGRPDPVSNYPIVINSPRPQPPQPPVPPTQPPSQGVYVQFASRTLKKGHTGPDVKFFQRQLNEIAGQGLLLDSYFGPKMEQAVINWQTFFGLDRDGILGAKTQQSIIEISLVAS